MTGTLDHVLIVEDHDLLSQSVALALRAEGFDVAVVNPASEAQVINAAQHHGSQLVLLDLDLGPGMPGGEDLVAGLTATSTRVLVVTGTEDVARIGTAIANGAEGFVHKSQGFDALLEAVMRAAKGEAPTDPSELRRMEQQVAGQREERRRKLADFDRLTDREQQVLARLMAGDAVEAIASASVVSVATVRTQVRGILTKLGVNSQLAAVALAHKLDWRHEDRQEGR